MRHPLYECRGPEQRRAGEPSCLVTDDYEMAMRHMESDDHLVMDMCCMDGTCDHVQPDGASSGCWHERNPYRALCSVCGLGFIVPSAAWEHFETSGNNPRHDIDRIAA